MNKKISLSSAIRAQNVYVNAVSQDLILTTNVVWDMDWANLFVSQIYDFLTPNTNNVVVRFGQYVIPNAFVNGCQTRDETAFLKCIKCLVDCCDGDCRVENANATIYRIGAGMRVVI